MVAGARQCASRSTITPTKTCSANLYRHIKRRMGRSLGGTHYKGNLVPSRTQVTQKLSGTKGDLSGPKRVPRSLLKQHSSHSYKQYHSGCLHKQGGVKLGLLCALLWSILTWCSRKQVTLKARHIPGQLSVVADKLSRLGQTIQREWPLPDVPINMQQVASTSDGSICYKVEVSI